MPRLGRTCSRALQITINTADMFARGDGPYPYRFTTNTHQDYFIVISLLRYLLRCLFARVLFKITAIYIFIILCLYETFLFSLVLFRYNVSLMFMQRTCCIVVMSGGRFCTFLYMSTCFVYNGCRYTDQD